MVRPVEEWRVQARLGLADRVRIGKSWSGWIGEAWIGLVRQGRHGNLKLISIKV